MAAKSAQLEGSTAAHTQESQQNRPKWTPYRAWLARKAAIAARDPAHVRARYRTLFPSPNASGLVDRALSAVWPWEVREYPGRQRLRAWLLGCSVEAGRKYRDRPPAFRAVIAAERIEGLARDLLAMAAELRAYAGSDRDAPSATASGSVPPPECET